MLIMAWLRCNFARCIERPGSEKLFQSENFSGCEMQTGPIIKSPYLSQLMKKCILIKIGMPKQDLPQSERGPFFKESYFTSVNTIFHTLACGSFEI